MMPLHGTAGVLCRADRWFACRVAMALLAGSLLAGCQAGQGRVGAERSGAATQPGAVVLYPGHAAPGRVVALRPITGTSSAQARPVGAVRQAITGETTQPGLDSRLLRPVSLAVRGGKILICDTGCRALLEADPRTGALQRVKLHGLVGEIDPVAVAVDGRGDAYVADAAGKRVVQIGPLNAVLRTYAAAAGVPFVPIDLAVSGDRLYAVNRVARRVDVFDLYSAEFLGPLGGEGPSAPVFPVAVTLDGEGRLYVVDMVSCRVRVYDRAGQLVRDIGGPGDRPGLFAQPRGVAVGPDGITYVSDVATQMVQMFDPAGVLLMYFGGADGSIGQMGMPAKIIADRGLLEAFASQMPRGFVPQYMMFVANQVGPGRIGVYAYGQLNETKEASPP